MKILLAAVGSAFGGVLRYLLPTWLPTSGGFPWAKLSAAGVLDVLIEEDIRFDGGVGVAAGEMKRRIKIICQKSVRSSPYKT